ncbi:sulfurtransferase TusA family protein [Pseudorhodobacter sp. MZDSW-24AT]|uniref:sulfurtransferase TusA family protein n=1 Tax=Pseudorhodobacter sp. MZDSW-24AT TaxID=2052957 RepID=UPI000C1EE2FE|nr:sulfurtransferase TusA family protein [Pseudorhodobacter sp. MZDSW-24AT]PJF09754.1 sulfurtransferase TusA family protein [Pseudorhodobacter sp. MZDSW-24AT]
MTRAWDDEVDAAGLLCPLPVLRARKRLLAMQPGQVLRVVATDPAAVIDLPHFCSQSGDVLLSSEQEGTARVFLIRKGSA